LIYLRYLKEWKGERKNKGPTQLDLSGANEALPSGNWHSNEIIDSTGRMDIGTSTAGG